MAQRSHEKPAQNSSGSQKDDSKSGLDALLQHPNLWRAGQLADQQRQSRQAIATGFSELDRHLPGQGWPSGGLMELMPSATGIGELRLLAPALKALSRAEVRWVAWINPPFVPYAPALKTLGIDIDKILLIHPKQHQDALWALERAAKSGSCSAILAWLDERELKAKDTQRLQVAAKLGRTLTCLLRPTAAQHSASMAELRLALRPSEQLGKVHVDVCKRRGGWPLENLTLDLASVTHTEHRSMAEIRAQLEQWRQVKQLHAKQEVQQAQSASASASEEPSAPKETTLVPPLRNDDQQTIRLH
jgi:cell division inhibitor SulA/protein ImuA